MKVLITGGTGFVGTNLTHAFTGEGHQVTVLTRRIREDRPLPAGASYLEGDPKVDGPWRDAIPDHEVIVNLAGSSIFRRWTDKAKQSILESRLRTTQHLVQALDRSRGKNQVLVSASAVGYYGSREDEPLNEESAPGGGFLGTVAQEWEAAASKAEALGVRVVRTRFGIVLGREGGALKSMIPLFRWCLGSPLGSGKQWFSWIHEEDLSRIFLFVIANNEVSGPVNCTSPNPVRNREFTRALGKALGRPTFLPAVPGWLLKLVLGEFGSVLLEGQKVLPQRLQELGFHFHHADMEAALRDLAG